MSIPVTCLAKVVEIPESLLPLYQALGYGPDEGTSVPKLAGLFEVDGRQIRTELETLVEAGIPVVILPKPGGKSVYIARTEDEFLAAIKSLESRRDAISSRIDESYSTLDQVFRKQQRPNQLRMAM